MTNTNDIELTLRL